MARHGGGRGWYGKVLGAALGVTLLASGASIWTAQAGAVGGLSPKATASATPPVAVTIAHASDKGRAASTSPSTTAPTPCGPLKCSTCCGSTG